MSDFFGQLWKEYTLSDSRYMISDPFTLCMETITAVCGETAYLVGVLMLVQVCWGPMCYLTAYLIVRDSPYRHPLQAFVSTGQLYGDVLYYATSMFTEWHTGTRYYRPEPQYYWIYFAFLNAFWIVIPACEPPSPLVTQQ